MVIVDAVVPPLYASNCTNVRGELNCTFALVIDGPLKLMLLVVKPPQAEASHHGPLAKSIPVPASWPTSVRSGAVSELKVSVVVALPLTVTCVGTLVAVGGTA